MAHPSSTERYVINDHWQDISGNHILKTEYGHLALSATEAPKITERETAKSAIRKEEGVKSAEPAHLSST